MTDNNRLAVGLFSNHQDAESAVKELQKSGFLMQNKAAEAAVHEATIG